MLVGAEAEMKELCGDLHAVAPQFFNGDKHAGDFAAFEYAIEEEQLPQFLGV